jgi:hypothetical protein
MAKVGAIPKNSKIADNFNTDKKMGASKEELRALRRAQRRDKEKIQKKEQKVLELQAELETLTGKEDTGASEEYNDKSAYKMLMDMRHIYNSVKGRAKLKEMVLDDPKQFGFLVKELLKIETALMSAKIRSKESGMGSNVTTFVILKGLDDEKNIVNGIVDITGRGVDVAQIRDAINPTAEQKIEPNEPEVEGPKL